MEILREFRDAPDSFHLELPPPTPVVQKEPTAAKQVETESVAARSDDPFSIDTMASSSSSTRIAKAPSIRRKRRKATPKWLVPALIVGMIATLVAVLFVMSKMVG